MVEVTAMNEDADGGAVRLSKADGVWASYKVATVGDFTPPAIFYAGASLEDGRVVQFFLNRETGLVVVDVRDKNGKGGREIVRMKL